MHPAHLDALLAVLEGDSFPRRKTWPRVYRHLRGIARGGVIPCSMNAVLMDGPGRPALTGLVDKTLDKVLWALRNLQLLALDVVPSSTSKMPEKIWRLIALPELNSAELVFGLELIVDKPKSLRRTFCSNLELPKPKASWSKVAHFFKGERLTRDDLLSEPFRVQHDLKFPEPAINSVARVATQLQPGGQGHFADLLQGGVATQFGGGHPVTGSTWPPSCDEGVGHLRSRSLSSGGGCAAGDQGSLGSVRSEGGEHMGSEKVDRLLGSIPGIKKASDIVNPGGKNRKPPKKRKTVTLRAQDLRQWEHWKSCKPLLDRIYGPDCITFQDTSAPPAEVNLGDASELVAGIDPSCCNLDAIKTIEVLMKGHQQMLQQRISPSEVPALLLKAWIGWAHLFNKPYSGPGDQSCIPEFRLIFRRLTAGQPRLQTREILQRMAGFAFFMDGLRRNRKVQYYPKQAWVDIYGRDATKYMTAWQDALATDSKIKDPLSYMLGLEPFVKPTDDEGNPILPPEPTPAEKLAAIRKRLQERIPIVRAGYLLGPDAWDKLPERTRMEYAIGKDYDEMLRLEKELEGDPPVQAVP